MIACERRQVRFPFGGLIRVRRVDSQDWRVNTEIKGLLPGVCSSSQSSQSTRRASAGVLQNPRCFSAPADSISHIGSQLGVETSFICAAIAQADFFPPQMGPLSLVIVEFVYSPLARALTTM